jgi:hypothetical protein
VSQPMASCHWQLQHENLEAILSGRGEYVLSKS